MKKFMKRLIYSLVFGIAGGSVLFAVWLMLHGDASSPLPTTTRCLCKRDISGSAQDCTCTDGWVDDGGSRITYVGEGNTVIGYATTIDLTIDEDDAIGCHSPRACDLLWNATRERTCEELEALRKRVMPNESIRCEKSAAIYATSHSNAAFYVGCFGVRRLLLEGERVEIRAERCPSIPTFVDCDGNLDLLPYNASSAIVYNDHGCLNAWRGNCMVIVSPSRIPMLPLALVDGAKICGKEIP